MSKDKEEIKKRAEEALNLDYIADTSFQNFDFKEALPYLKSIPFTRDEDLNEEKLEDIIYKESNNTSVQVLDTLQVGSQRYNNLATSSVLPAIRAISTILSNLPILSKACATFGTLETAPTAPLPPAIIPNINPTPSPVDFQK